MRQTIAPPSDPPRLTPNPEQIAEPWREVVDPKEAQTGTSVRGTDGRGPLLTPSTSTKSPLLSDQGTEARPHIGCWAGAGLLLLKAQHG